MGFFDKRKPSTFTRPLIPEAAPGPVAPEDVCRHLCQKALLWERYLYEDHTRKQLAVWAQRLHYFRFCRAYGGHNNDGDQLIVLLRTPDQSALFALCEALDIPLRPMPSEEELARVAIGERPSSSRHFPGWQQPKHVEIQGARVFCWLASYMPKDTEGKLTGEAIPALQLSLADRDNLWAVSEAAVTQAQVIEPLMAPFAAQVIDPPQDDRNCICPKHYPEMFGLWHRATAQWPWNEPDPR